MKHKILKLNKVYMPIGIADWREVIKNIFTVAVYPLDMNFEVGEDGVTNFEKIDYFEVVKTWEDWEKLPIRPFDDIVHTSKRAVRLPSVVVCADYDKIVHKRAIFPSNKNIWERDNYTCGYTLKKLSRADLTVDHIIPKSRCEEFGIEPNSWENLITCNREINNRKSDKTPEEAGLKLRMKAFKPKNGWVFSALRDQWKPFVGALR